MHIMNTLTYAVLSGLASAAVFEVNVGANGNAYSPSTITAQIGDSVTFKFNNILHDVVQSTANAPCSYSSPAGFYSTLQSNSNASFTVAITDNQPKYFFCSVSNHCNVGMVGIINPGNVTQTEFARNARSAQVSAPTSTAQVGGNLTTGTSTSVPGASGTSNTSRPATTSTTTAGSAVGMPMPHVALIMAAFLFTAYL